MRGVCVDVWMHVCTHDWLDGAFSVSMYLQRITVPDFSWGMTPSSGPVGPRGPTTEVCPCSALSVGALCNSVLLTRTHSVSWNNEMFLRAIQRCYVQGDTIWVELNSGSSTRQGNTNAFTVSWSNSEFFSCSMMGLIASCRAWLLHVVKIKSLCRRAFPVWQEIDFRDKAYLHKDGRKEESSV